MFKKHVKFKDFQGNDRETTLYFNLSKAEVAEMEMNESQMATDGGITGGIQQKLETISAGGKGSEILKAFKDIVFMAYGRRENDEEFGERFAKSAEYSKRFESSGAYEEFFMWLVSDENNAAEFVRGALPEDWSEKRDQDKPDPSRRPGQAAQPTQVEAPKAAEPTQGRAPTEAELEEFMRRREQGNDNK